MRFPSLCCVACLIVLTPPFSRAAHPRNDTSVARRAAPPRARGPVDVPSDWISATYYGARCDGIADDTAPLRAGIAAGHASGKPILLPPGTCTTERLVLRTGQRLLGSNWQGGDWTPHLHGKRGTGIAAGFGPGATILRSRSGDTVLQLGDDTKYMKNIEVGYLVVQGRGQAVGNAPGIYSAGPGGGHSHLHLHHIAVIDFGGNGIELVREWTSRLDYVSVDNVGGNAFDLQGGNTTLLVGCYAHRVGRGKAGYRIHTGRPVLLSCNGLDIGDSDENDWGVFGDQPSSGDVRSSGVQATLIGCNIEDFLTRGLWFKAGSSGTLIGDTFVSPDPSHGPTTAIRLDDPGDGFFIDGSTAWLRQAGATWARGFAIHATHPPIIVGTANSWTNAADIQNYWNLVSGEPTPIPRFTAAEVLTPSVRLLGTPDAGVCTERNGGRTVFVPGGVGRKDSLLLCAKDSTGTYRWRSIY